MTKRTQVATSHDLALPDGASDRARHTLCLEKNTNGNASGPNIAPMTSQNVTFAFRLRAM